MCILPIPYWKTLGLSKGNKSLKFVLPTKIKRPRQYNFKSMFFINIKKWVDIYECASPLFTISFSHFHAPKCRKSHTCLVRREISMRKGKWYFIVMRYSDICHRIEDHLGMEYMWLCLRKIEPHTLQKLRKIFIVKELLYDI